MKILGIIHPDDSEWKCPNCNWNMLSSFRFEEEPQELSLCAECFVSNHVTEWEDEATEKKGGES